MRAELRFEIFIALSNKERGFSTSMVIFRRERALTFRVILNIEAAGPSHSPQHTVTGGPKY
jgi:hypothetical protein